MDPFTALGEFTYKRDEELSGYSGDDVSSSYQLPTANEVLSDPATELGYNPFGDGDLLTQAFGENHGMALNEETEAAAIQAIAQTMQDAANAYLAHQAWLAELGSG